MEKIEENQVEAPAPEGWTKPPELKDLKADLESAKPAHDTQCQKISAWLDNLNVTGTAKIKRSANRSNVQPKLIRKQAEWRYTALSEPFLSAEDMFAVNPVTWEDADGARQNQIVLNNQINTKVNKQKFIDDLVRDAVNKGTAIIRTGWVFEEELITGIRPVYSFRPNPALAPLMEELDRMESENPTGYKFEVPEEMQQAHQVSRTAQTPMEPYISGREEYEEMRTLRNHPTAEVCDYKNVTIDPSCGGDMEKAGFVVFSFDTSMSELRKEGRYTNLDEINIAVVQSPLSEPDHQGEDESGFQFKDDPRKKIVAHEYWGYWDYDESGIAKPFVATWVGDTMIRLEETPFPDGKLPFVFMAFMPEEDSAYGEPDGELLVDNQLVVGAITRGMVDILGNSANGQTGVRKDALDATNRRKYQNGEDYEYNPHIDPRMAFYMHTYNEIPQSATFLLNQQNMEAESMTGVKTFTDGINGNQLGEVVAGIKGAMDAASKRETGILRRMAKGIVEMGRKFVAMNAEFLDEEEVVRMTNGEFVPIRRDDLAGNYDLKLTISTAEEDAAKIEKLAFTLQTMGPKMDFGASKIIMTQIARLQNMPELAHQLETFEPTPDPIQEELGKLAVEKARLENAEIESKIRENYASAGLDQAKVEDVLASARLKGSSADKSDLDFVEQESGVTQERDLQKQGEQARGNIELEKYKQRVAPAKDAKAKK